MYPISYINALVETIFVPDELGTYQTNLAKTSLIGLDQSDERNVS